MLGGSAPAGPGVRMSAAGNGSVWLRPLNCSHTRDLTLPLFPDRECPSNRKYAAALIPLLLHALSLLGAGGNLWSVWTCLRPARPWSVGSMGVLNLALCDLAYLASMGPWAVYISSDYRWNIGRSLCVAVKVLYFVGMTSGTVFICAISLDRFFAIVFPLESRLVRTQRNTALASLLLWAITCVQIYFRYPNIVFQVREDGVHVCGSVVISRFRTTEVSYSLLSYYSVQVSIPLLIIVPSYVKILGRVTQSRQQWGGSQGRDKTIWLIALFIANFLVCWVPGQVLHIVACVVFFYLNECGNTCWVAWVVNLLSEVSHVLNCVNACLDPLILHAQLRSGPSLHKLLMEALRRLWRRQEPEVFSVAPT